MIRIWHLLQPRDLACSCWLDRPAFYYGFALPVGIVIVLNAVIFIFIIKGITCDRGSGLQSTQSRAELNWLQLQAAIASFVILGGKSTFAFWHHYLCLCRDRIQTGPILPNEKERPMNCNRFVISKTNHTFTHTHLKMYTESRICLQFVFNV